MFSPTFGNSNHGNQVGINYGVVNLPPPGRISDIVKRILFSQANDSFLVQDQQRNQPQTRPKPQPSSTVPFQQDPMFVGREDMIRVIQEKHGAVGQRHERVALVGLAGVGLAMYPHHRVSEQ